MRAMPSPTSRTVPTPTWSIAGANCSSSRDRIDVTSSGRIAISFSLRYAPALEAVAKLFELVADAPVDDRIAHADHDAAHDVGIDGDVQDDLLSGLAVEGGDQRLALRIRHWDRR